VAEVNIEDKGEDRIMKAKLRQIATYGSENGALPQRKTGMPIIEINVRLRNIVTVPEVCTIYL
jgi:hypothetical protein